jgi:leucyl-tRNA synthetase
MFIGPWDEGGPFGLEGIAGLWRWLNRVWSLALSEPKPGRAAPSSRRELRRATHKTVRRVTEDIERFRFNTLLAALMELTNTLMKARDGGPVDRQAWEEAIEALLLMLAPAAPHLAEELWARRGRPYSVHQQSWPSFDPELAREEEVTLVVQVNGRVRDRLLVPADIDEGRAKGLALASPRVQAHINRRPLQRVVYVPGKLVNVVVR